MVISPDVLKKFREKNAFILFKEQLNYSCKDSFSRLYQSIMKNEDKNTVKDFYCNLGQKDKELILEIIEEKNGNFCQLSTLFINKKFYNKLEEALAFADFDLFQLAVQKVILDKFKKLSQEDKNKVYGKIYELAGCPKTDDLQWEEHHVTKNMPRLADALAFVERQNL